MVNKYYKPDIFTDSNRVKYIPTHYRENNKDNLNRIANNNTSFRVFNHNNPQKNDIQPILD